LGLWVGLVDVSASPDQPKLPHIFYGAVWVDGAPAPIGTMIEGRGEGVTTGIDCNPLTTVEVGRYGNPGVTPPEDLLIQGDIDGGTPIEFYVNELRAECREVDQVTGEYIGGWVDTYPWSSDKETELNLRVFDAYTLTVASGGCCAISVTYDANIQSIPPEGSWTVISITGGLTVTLQAFDDPGAYCVFNAWVGDLITTANPATFNVRSNMIITATALEDYSLTTYETGSGEGTVIRSPDQMTYPQGTVVTLNAVPSETSVFDGWSGDVSPGLSEANPISFTMDGDKEITATFEFYDVAISPLTSQKMDDPGAEVTHKLQVVNTGRVTDTFNVMAVGSSTWSRTIIPPLTVGPLAADGVSQMRVEVQIPPDAAACAMDVTTITLTSQGDPRKSATALLRTVVTGECYFYDIFLPLVKKGS
jgi:hypothetical protein